MSNKKISELTEMTALSGNDLLLVAENNGDGSYTSKKIQVSNFKGEWQLVERKTFTEAATSYTFSGLNGDLDLRYKIVAKLINPTGGGVHLRAVFSNDNVANYLNYISDWSSVDSHPNLISESGGFIIIYASANLTGFGFTEIDAKTGSNRYGFNRQTRNASTSAMQARTESSCMWTDTSTNITSITTFIQQATNGIGIGSYIELWKLAQ